jgi:alkanesulfonate monooxygenase SsuD/methylene tetrahydromethanopterin reductase-like flavin-dependent oxidoreductase (luciferase family)
MLTRNGFGEDVQAVIAAWQQGSKTANAAVSARMLDATTVIGTPQEIVSKLDAWGEQGVDEPLLTMPGGSIDETGAQLAALMEELASQAEA